MSYPLIITKNNLVPGSSNTYKYDFNSNVDMSNIDIGVGSASLWFSWRNITTLKNNNKFTINHPINGAFNQTLNITIPDGGYDIDDINNYLRFYLISNGYFIQNNTTNEQIVYCKFQVNPTIYVVEFIEYPIPTSLPAGFTAGSAFSSGFPTTTRAPQLNINQVGFSNVIGFSLGIQPPTQATTLTTIISSKTPVVSDVQNIIITLDSAMNPYSQNARVIHSISPAGYKYSSLIKNEPSEVSYVPQQMGGRQSITLQITNQDLVPLELVDTDIVIKLLLRIRDRK